jgi:hypothetical protein
MPEKVEKVENYCLFQDTAVTIKKISVYKMKRRLRRNGMMKIGLSLILNLEADYAKIVGYSSIQNTEPIVL